MTISRIPTPTTKSEVEFYRAAKHLISAKPDPAFLHRQLELCRKKLKSIDDQWQVELNGLPQSTHLNIINKLKTDFYKKTNRDNIIKQIRMIKFILEIKS